MGIPFFVKSMGYRIISYILNISEEDAQEVLNSKYNLSKKELIVLSQFIDYCRKLRMEGIDQNDPDYNIISNYQDIGRYNKHPFTIWHEEMGGSIKIIDNEDPILAITYKIAIKIYPHLLIKMSGKSRSFDQHQNMHIWSMISFLPEAKELRSELIKDHAISKIFDQIEDSDKKTGSYYMASSGCGGSLQLYSLPTILVTNSFDLMRMRGFFSLDEFAKAAEYTLNLIRRCANGEVVNVPVFIGFNNVYLKDIEKIETEWGTLRPYHDGITDLSPNNTSSTTVDGKNHKLGFVLETTYPYKVKFGGNNDNNNKFPKELNGARENLAKIEENICLCFALACERTPPVGLHSAWTMIFDPITIGTNLSWRPDPRSPVSSYILDNNTESIMKWSKKLKDVDDTKIRIAIRRILSAINERTNPIDGFVDTIIAWENLFGGNAELSFRISISIAKLLGKTEEERLKIQKEIIKYYNTRSILVHGVNDISTEEAIKYRDHCLDISLKALRKLYLDRSNLINHDSRSKILALL
tara:strand:+ start:4981 stop:6558 length:1578 start_codon:yes stop_codon:yes gene_type:complete